VAARCEVQERSAVSCTKTAALIETPFGLWARMGPRKHVLHGVQIALAKGQLFLGERTCQCMLDNTLPWAVQNGWTDRDAICAVDSDGPKRACYMRVHVGATWRIYDDDDDMMNTIEPSECGDDAAFFVKLL